MSRTSKLGRGNFLAGDSSAGPGGPAENRETYYIWQYDEAKDQTEFLGTTYERISPGPDTLHLTEEQHLHVLDRETVLYQLTEKR